jgi:lysophospholipase L1-like esterase
MIDGTLVPTLKTIAGDNTYTLASGLTDAEHTVEFYRRTEASQGTTVVRGIQAQEGDAGTGQMLAPPAAHSRIVEVVGDSITCGYGDEGVNPCSWSPDTENSYLAYGSILARDLGAELFTVAWSGEGVYYNYNGVRTLPMPTLYDYSNPGDRTHPWSFVPQANLVIINLGTNDYSTGNDPTTDQFVTAYQALLEHIRSKYPAAYILCTMGPLLNGTALSTVRTNIGTAIAARASAGDTRVKYHEITTANTNPGCDYHPSVATQAAMAAELEAEVNSDLGW